MKRKINVAALILVMTVGAAQAERVVKLERIPGSMVKPCERSVPLTELTRLVVPMFPGRGVNLILPKELDLRGEDIGYSISSGDIMTYKKMIGGSRIVPLGFKSVDFDQDDGKVRDFTITTENFVISMGLTVDTDPAMHCTNILFELTEAEKQRIEKINTERYQAVLDNKYRERMEQMDREVADKALLLVAGLATDNPDLWRIKEEGYMELPTGDEVIAFVRDIKRFGDFYVLSFDVENESRSTPVYIKGSKVIFEGREIRGAWQIPKKIDEKSVVEATFSTTERIPSSMARLTIITDSQPIEVKW